MHCGGAKISSIASPTPTWAELRARVIRLQVALEAVAQPGLLIAGVGHSIGAAALLILAGAEALSLDGAIVRVAVTPTITKLALMAPPTQFFAREGALAGMQADIAIWAGERDDITPPEQARFLQRALGGTRSVRLHITPQAGHFSFMAAPPPHVVDTLPDRDAFLVALAEKVGGFVVD